MPDNPELRNAFEQILQRELQARYTNAWTTNSSTTDWEFTTMPVDKKKLSQDFDTPIVRPYWTNELDWKTWLSEKFQSAEEMEAGVKENVDKIKKKFDEGKGRATEVAFVHAYDNLVYDMGV